ncbi:Ankyrin-1 [Araneus ventricosus]|uniref:Alpha-latrotoxin n=1 Tax=Araneus ventricosus TaxID=182803 RepID=A0A4Y2MF58_ARAVE|nr:Ankyrin-1 [Araneus ventricosus]
MACAFYFDDDSSSEVRDRLKQRSAIARDRHVMEVIRQLLEKDGRGHARDCFGHTPLHLAVRLMQPNPGLVEELLDHGAEVNEVDIRGNTVLHSAVADSDDSACQLEVVKMILNNGADVNALNMNRLTPLAFALCKGNTSLSLIEELLMYGSDPNLGKSALYFAVGNGDCSYPVVKLLLNHGAEPNADTLHHAIECLQYKTDVIQVLLFCGIDVNERNSAGLTPLILVIRQTRFSLEVCVECVDLLLAYGVDVNAVDTCGNTPLHHTILMRNQPIGLEIAKILLEEGADQYIRNHNEMTPLQMFKDTGRLNFSFIQELLMHDTDENFGNGLSPLYYNLIKLFLDFWEISYANILLSAIQRTRCEKSMILKFVTRCISLNKNDFSKYTAFHFAVEAFCDFRLVEALLEVGVRVDVLDSKYRTPLHIAAMTKTCPLTIVKLLLKFGANVNAVCGFGYTPLMYAAKMHDDEKVVEELLKNGANPNGTNEVGSAIHYAAVNPSGNANILRILFQYGGDVNNVNPSCNVTPLLYALYGEYKLNQIQELLRNGARLDEEDEDMTRACSLGLILSNTYKNKDLLPIVRELLNFENPSLRLKIGTVLFNILKNRTIPLNVLEELLKSGLNVNCMNSQSETPLSFALQDPLVHKNAIELLLKHGAWATPCELPWIHAFNTCLYNSSAEETFLNCMIKYFCLQMYYIRRPCIFNADNESTYLSSHITFCKNEFENMSMVVLPCERLLIDFLADTEECNDESTLDKIMHLYNSHPIYSDVLGRKLNRKFLLERLLTLKVYTVCDNHEIVLNADSQRMIAVFLTNESLCNFVAAFCYQR